MSGVLNKFFTCFHKKLKISGLLFLRFDNCGPLERGHRANVMIDGDGHSGAIHQRALLAALLFW